MTEQEIKERLAHNWLVINAAKQLVLFVKEKLNEVNLSVLKKIKHSDAVNVIGTLGTIVESAKAVNSVQEYKGKDKVNKELSELLKR